MFSVFIFVFCKIVIKPYDICLYVRARGLLKFEVHVLLPTRVCVIVITVCAMSSIDKLLIQGKCVDHENGGGRTQAHIKHELK